MADPAVDFYRAEADRQGGRVLELGCGTGQKLIPTASDGRPCVGLDFSSDMLAEAQRKADERGVAVEWVQGDMRVFDLGRTFDFVFISANSLLHLHEAGARRVAQGGDDVLPSLQELLEDGRSDQTGGTGDEDGAHRYGLTRPSNSARVCSSPSVSASKFGVSRRTTPAS